MALAGRARDLGVDGPLLHAAPAAALAQIAGLPNGTGWLADLDSFLGTFGQRTEETCRIDTPSWIEDPSPALSRSGRSSPSQPGSTSKPPARRRSPSGTRRSSPRAAGQRGEPAAVQRGPGGQPGRELRLVERGAQLPHRPPRGHPGPPRRPWARYPAGRRRRARAAGRHVLLVQAGLFDVMAGGGSGQWPELTAMIPTGGRTSSTGEPAARNCPPCSAPSPTRCRTRS